MGQSRKQRDRRAERRLAGREVGLSKNTVAGIVKRARTAPARP
jgi:hypothetical protein